MNREREKKKTEKRERKKKRIVCDIDLRFIRIVVHAGRGKAYIE